MSKNTEQDVAFIRALAEVMRECDLSEIEVKREYGDDDTLRARLVRSSPTAPAAGAPAPAAVPTPAAEPQAPPPAPAAEAPGGPEPVTSPMVGTVYLAAEPGADPFVRVGDQVGEGDTLLIIEAMKTMNQIPSPVAGTVRRILVDNAEPVEYGAPLVLIE